MKSFIVDVYCIMDIKKNTAYRFLIFQIVNRGSFICTKEYENVITTNSVCLNSLFTLENWFGYGKISDASVMYIAT